MPDFHIVSLSYKLIISENVTYNNPPPIEYETELAHYLLDKDLLTCKLKMHFSTEREARIAIEPILKAWEVETSIRKGVGELGFEFEKSEIIDRSPPQTIPGYHLHAGSISMTVSVSDSVSLRVGRGRYPDPPRSFQITPDVESLWFRFKGCLEGREPLLSMAYFCLTVLEASAGGRRAAASKYRVDERVLRKLGELTSKRGDRATARKASAGPMPPLTGSEGTWIQSVIKTVILRLGDNHHPTSLNIIRMQDLPSL